MLGMHVAGAQGAVGGWRTGLGAIIPAIITRGGQLY